MGCAPSNQAAASKQSQYGGSGNTSSTNPKNPSSSNGSHISSPKKADLTPPIEHETERPQLTPVVPEEADLSDISSVSEELPSSTNLGRTSSFVTERDQAVPTIEDELFEYDDVKIEKPDKAKFYERAFGRRSTFLGKIGSNLSKQSNGDFAFSDFCVSVDEEMDNIVPVSPGSPTTKRLLSPKAEHAEIKRFEVRNLLGHSSRVKCIAIAPGEKEFVSCSNEDASVTLSSLRSGKEMGIFTGHTDTVINATFSNDGKYLATTSRDHTLILWDVVTAKQILTFDHSKVVICCCFSKDSKFIATGCQDKICRLWETKKGREALLFAQHEGIVICMSYAPDNLFIVSASADKTLRVWSTQTGRCKFLLLGHVGIVLSCHYTADGTRIVSNDEKLLKVWNAHDGTSLLDIPVESVTSRMKDVPAPAKKLTWTLSCVAPGAFTRYMLVACNNRFVYVLDVVTGEEVTSVFCKAPVYCLTTGFHHVAAFGDSFGNLYVVNMS